MDITEYDLEQAQREFNNTLSKGILVARKNNMNLTKFKKEVKKGLQAINNEDQWTFDYESYLCCISELYQSPIAWAEEYYFDRWLLIK